MVWFAVVVLLLVMVSAGLRAWRAGRGATGETGAPAVEREVVSEEPGCMMSVFVPYEGDWFPADDGAAGDFVEGVEEELDRVLAGGVGGHEWGGGECEIYAFGASVEGLKAEAMGVLRGIGWPPGARVVFSCDGVKEEIVLGG